MAETIPQKPEEVARVQALLRKADPKISKHVQKVEDLTTEFEVWNDAKNAAQARGYKKFIFQGKIYGTRRITDRSDKHVEKMLKKAEKHASGEEEMMGESRKISREGLRDLIIEELTLIKDEPMKINIRKLRRLVAEELKQIIGRRLNEQFQSRWCEPGEEPDPENDGTQNCMPRPGSGRQSSQYALPQGEKGPNRTCAPGEDPDPENDGIQNCMPGPKSAAAKTTAKKRRRGCKRPGRFPRKLRKYYVRGDRGASFAKFYAAVKKNPKAVEAIGKLDCRWGDKHTAALKIIAAGGERTKATGSKQLKLANANIKKLEAAARHMKKFPKARTSVEIGVIDKATGKVRMENVPSNNISVVLNQEKQKQKELGGAPKGARGTSGPKVSKALSLDQLKDKNDGAGVNYNDVKRAYDGAANDNDKRAIKAWVADQLGAAMAARLAGGGGTKQTTHMPLTKAVRHVKYWKNAVGKRGGGPGNSRLRKLQAAVKVLKGVPGGEEQYNKLFK